MGWRPSIIAIVATVTWSLIPLGAGAAGSPYKPGTGPFPVRIDDSVSLDVRPDGPAMAVRVVYPDGPGPWPVIIFSHGMLASNQKYMPLLEQWAARGYAVVAPNHPDANGGFAPRGNDDVEKLAVTRVLDLTRLMDAMPELEKAIPALRGKLRAPPYVAAGHSLGTYTAMVEAGLRLRNPQTGAVTEHADPRIGAVIMSSDPGKMALMPGDVWQGVDVPTFMVTGTDDYGVAGKGRKATDYTTEVLSGAAAAQPKRGVPRYRLLLAGGDHYFGGLIHRDPGGLKPDVEGLALFADLSTAFMDAYVRADPAALNYLRNTDVAGLSRGRATLTGP